MDHYSFTTGEALTKYSFVTLDGSGNVIMADAEAEVVLGVVMSAYGNGAKAKVYLGGVQTVIASEAIAVGDEVGPSTTDGQAQTGAVGSTIAGVALTAAAAAGEKFDVWLYADKTETA